MKMRLAMFVLAVLTTIAAGAVRAAAPETFGKGVSLKTVTPLDQMLKQPVQFEGKTVRVEGVVTAVCSEMGCWMALGAKDAPGAATMMIKVDDGVIVFPVSAKGRRAAAQGVVQRVKADDKEGNEAAREKANAEKTARPASSDTWLIKATGAVVY